VHSELEITHYCKFWYLFYSITITVAWFVTKKNLYMS